MKITCQSCHASYSIPDEKVTGEGRVFSIKCTTCSATITVEGIAANNAAASETGWYYAVGGERQGPVAQEQLLELVTQGTLEHTSYVWRSGMTDWKTIADCEELSSTPEEIVPTELESVSPTDAPQATTSDAFDDGAGEVAWEEPASDEPEEDIFSFDTAASPRSGADEVHARRDTSVLFSLDELAQINESTGGEKSEDLLTDTSGLIDIRAFAAQEEPSQDEALDDLFGASPAPVSAGVAQRPAFSGVSVPVMNRRKPKWVWIPIVLGIAGLSVGATILLTQDESKGSETASQVPGGEQAPAKTPAGKAPAQNPKPKTTPNVAKVPPTKAPSPKSDASGQAATPTGTAKQPAADVAKKATEPTPAAVDPAKPASAKKADKKKKAKKADKKKKAKKADKKKAKKPEKKKEPKPKVVVKAAPKPKKTKSSANVDHLLKMLDKKKKKAAGGTGGGGNANLPQSISSSSISSKIRGRQGRFNKCYKKQANRTASGAKLKVSFTIKNSGSVSGVRVSGPVSGAVRGCISGVIRRIKFKRFRNPTKKVGPLSIRVR